MNIFMNIGNMLFENGNSLRLIDAVRALLVDVVDVSGEQQPREGRVAAVLAVEFFRHVRSFYVLVEILILQVTKKIIIMKRRNLKYTTFEFFRNVSSFNVLVEILTLQEANNKTYY